MALSLFFKSIGEFKLSLGRQICISYKKHLVQWLSIAIVTNILQCLIIS